MGTWRPIWLMADRFWCWYSQQPASECNVTQTNVALPLHVNTIDPKKDIKLCYAQLDTIIWLMADRFWCWFLWQNLGSLLYLYQFFVSLSIRMEETIYSFIIEFFGRPFGVLMEIEKIFSWITMSLLQIPQNCSQPAKLFSPSQLSWEHQNRQIFKRVCATHRHHMWTAARPLSSLPVTVIASNASALRSAGRVVSWTLGRGPRATYYETNLPWDSDVGRSWFWSIAPNLVSLLCASHFQISCPQCSWEHENRNVWEQKCRRSVTPLQLINGPMLSSKRETWD
jgi:hypothetical protein